MIWCRGTKETGYRWSGQEVDRLFGAVAVCGHDHCQEHIDEGKGPVYVLTGSGFECCYPGSNADKVPAGAIKMAYWLGACPPGAVAAVAR